jgi:Raf kinase inhibitor-like YbhB/YbcL family protein
MSRTLLCTLSALFLLTGCNSGGDATDLKVGATIPLNSGAFEPGRAIPKKYGKNGDNVPPPLAWTDAPKEVKTFALICDDPDAPLGTFVHWVIWNIPGDARKLGEGAPMDPNARQGKNGFGGAGYAGPDPPSGSHRYFFKLYALDAALELPDTTTKSDLEKAMKGHVLGHGELVGTYQK